jgi:hypothetical protein
MEYATDLIAAFRAHWLVNTAIAIVIWVIVTGFIEAFAKPLATNLFKRTSLILVPQLLKQFDPVMPDMIKQMTTTEIREHLAAGIFDLAAQENITVKPHEIAGLIRDYEAAYSPSVNARIFKTPKTTLSTEDAEPAS